jgi:hypothetical protein
LDIIKYFFEEPTSLESLTPDDDLDARQTCAPSLPLEAILAGSAYHRGYLAGTNLRSGRVGLTALARTDAIVEAIAATLDRYDTLSVSTVDQASGEVSRTDLLALLQDPSGVRAIAAGPRRPQAALLATSAAEPRRYAAASIRSLLDLGFFLLFPEPAHSGFDWSLFSRDPIREKLAAALGERKTEDMRIFVLPYQRARSEERFYFEQWALETELPSYIEEL